MILELIVKLFADHGYLCAVFHNLLWTANTLKEDLEEIRSWDERWNMVFNPDLTKQRQEVLFKGSAKNPFLQKLLAMTQEV